VLSLIQIYRALGGGWEMRLLREGNGFGNGACIGGMNVVKSGGAPAEAQTATPASTEKVSVVRAPAANTKAVTPR
jgi:hypothetical protein